MSSLRGKVALITGASSGIGAGTSVLFARFGALLALNGRDVENLSKVAKQCTDSGAAEVLSSSSSSSSSMCPYTRAGMWS